MLFGATCDEIASFLCGRFQTGQHGNLFSGESVVLGYGANQTISLYISDHQINTFVYDGHGVAVQLIMHNRTVFSDLHNTNAMHQIPTHRIVYGTEQGHLQRKKKGDIEEESLTPSIKMPLLLSLENSQPEGTSISLHQYRAQRDCQQSSLRRHIQYHCVFWQQTTAIQRIETE